MSTSGFLIAYLGFSMYSIMLSANSNSFTVSSLIAVARVAKTMLNISGESGRLCPILDLSGNAFSFSVLNVMLAMGLSYMAFTMLTCVPSMPTFWKVSYHKLVLNFVTSLFCIC